MRIAKILHASSPAPALAIELEGQLYLVAELARFYRSRFSPDEFDLSGDFHTRVFALGAAGLFELLDRLKNGVRPDGARALPGSFTWLPPCDPERATYVQVDIFNAPELPDGGPGYRLGTARSLRGHEESIPFPNGEEQPALEVGIAAILREELRRATAREAKEAILGVTLLCDWVAPSRRQGRWPGPSHDFASQLGPVLVTPDEFPGFAGRGLQIERPDLPGLGVTLAAPRFALAEAVAYVSQHVDLLAGDVVSVGPLPLHAKPGSGPQSGPVSVRYGERVRLCVDGLGELCGRPVRGPAETAWRRAEHG